MMPATDPTSSGMRPSDDVLSGIRHWEPTTRASSITGKYSGMNALYVGREPFLRDEVVSRLEKWFTRVQTAPDGGEALFAVRHSIPDLVVIDAETPAGSGIAAALEIRMAVPGAEVILIAIDGDPEAFSELARLDIACHCIMSPVREDDLRAGIENSVERMRRERVAFGMGRLSAAKAVLPTIIDHRDELIWAVDRHLRFTFINRTFRAAHHEMTGVEPHEGMHVIGEGEHFWSMRGHYERAMAGECISFQHGSDTGGQRRQFEITLSPFRAWGTPGAGVSGIARIIPVNPAASLPFGGSGTDEEAMSEVHHRVRNNFLLVQSLLRLQSRDVADETAKGLLAASENRINVLSLLHNGLAMHGSGLDVDMERYIQSLVVMLVRRHQVSGNTVRMTVEARNARLHARLAIPCGLLVNELVGEALRGALQEPRGCELYVGLGRKDEGMMALRVRGCGLAPVMDTPEGTMRCEVIKVLVEQLKGRILKGCMDARNGVLIEFPG